MVLSLSISELEDKRRQIVYPKFRNKPLSFFFCVSTTKLEERDERLGSSLQLEVVVCGDGKSNVFKCKLLPCDFPSRR